MSAPRRLRHPGSVVPPLVLRLLLAQAVVALAVAAAAAHSPLLWALAGLGAVVLVPSVLVSRRFGVRMRYRMRARTVKSRTGDLRSGLLEHLDPSTVIDSIEVDGDRVGVVATDTGAVAVLELGGTAAGMLVDPPVQLPSPAALLPADDPSGAPVSVQLVVQVVPAARAETDVIAKSYLELAGATVPATRRAWLAVRVWRTPDSYTQAELRPALVAGLRSLRRRLRQHKVPAESLGPEALLDVTAALAGLGTPGIEAGAAASESWRRWSTAETVHSTHRMVGWPRPDWRIDALLRGVPAAAVTLGLAVTRPRGRPGPELAVELAVRVATTDQRRLATADSALAGLVHRAGGRCEPMPGEQVFGLAATLPLGGFAALTGGGTLTSRVGLHAADPQALAGLGAQLGGAGLIIGKDRHGAPVVVRPFRPQPTGIVAVGTLAFGQLLTMRQLALGASLAVQTTRPDSWVPFLQQCGVSRDRVSLGQPGTAPARPATADKPLLVVYDAGPVDPKAVAPVGRWQTTLVVREELTAWDVDLLGAANLVLMQRLTDVEAAMAAAALRFGQVQGWLPRISAEMVAVSEPGQLRWAMLDCTALERQMLPAVARFTAAAPAGAAVAGGPAPR